MKAVNKQQFIFGSFFFIANKLQVFGDKWDTQITMKQWFLVVMIAQFKEQAPTLTDVADLLGVSRQNVKQLALKLEHKGFVALQKDEGDSRALRMHLTTKCHDYFKQREEAELSYLSKFYDGITEEELEVMNQAFFKLFRNLDVLAAEREGGVKYENTDCL